MNRRKRIPVDDLTLDAVQSRDRAWVGDDIDRRLANSIASNGLIQDLLVRPVEYGHRNGNGAGEDDTPSYAIIAGSRRYHAAMEAGHETVPCKILHTNDLDAAWVSLSENTDRRELSEQEIAQQLSLIYELVRPESKVTECPSCGRSVDGGQALRIHCNETDCVPPSDTIGPHTVAGNDDLLEEGCQTDRQALTYLAQRFLGRTDDGAVALVRGHLRTADLPPLLQSLFKDPEDRTEQERVAMDNHDIDTNITLGSGEGKSGTSSEVIALHDTIEQTFEQEALDPTDAVLDTVGSLRFEKMSEQELRRTLREFRHDLTARINTDASVHRQRVLFNETLEDQAEQLRESYETVEPVRPFKKVDVLGPDTQRHSRWHVQVMQQRDITGHGELVRELYQERLETLAEDQGWD